MENREEKRTTETSPRRNCDEAPTGPTARPAWVETVRNVIPKGEGFTLVETLLTIFLAGLLATVLLTLAQNGQRAASGSLRISEATAVSNSIMSVILSGENEERSGTVRQGGRKFLWTVAVLKLPGERLESVDLTVQWTETSGVRSMTVSTLRAVNEPGSSLSAQ